MDSNHRPLAFEVSAHGKEPIFQKKNLLFEKSHFFAAFDESDKFIKLYYTVPGITAAPTDSVNAKFSEK